MVSNFCIEKKTTLETHIIVNQLVSNEITIQCRSTNDVSWFSIKLYRDQALIFQMSSIIV